MGRNVLLDRVRGYACFLVLFGHVLSGMHSAQIGMPSVFHGLETFLWTFHVPLFLFLSGAVYSLRGEWRGKKTKGRFILHKLLALGVPYVVFSAVYVIINSAVPGANTQFSLLDILFIWKTPIAQYWYLYALFFLFCIYAALSGILKNWQITALLTALGFIAAFLGVGFGAFDIVIYSALAFGLGTFVKTERALRISQGAKLLTLFAHVLVGILLIRVGVHGYMGIKEVLMVLGIYASFQLVSLLAKYPPFGIALDFLNRYSLEIYLLHTIFTAGIRIVLLKLGITNWCLHMACGILFGLLGSVLCAMTANKVKILKACFFPTRAFSKKRKDIV